METIQDWVTLLAGAAAAIWAWVKRENLLGLLSAAVPAVKAAGTAAVEAATTIHDDAITHEQAQAAAQLIQRWEAQEQARLQAAAAAREQLAKTLPMAVKGVVG